MTFTHALATNNYGPQKFIVSASAANGTHTTIQAAITAATAGDTVFIRTGTYTENLTLKAGVNLCANETDQHNNVTIIGNATFTQAGTVAISGIELQTNGSFCLSVTGSAASVIDMTSCFINCTNNTGISFTSSSASSFIGIDGCNLNLATTGIAYWSCSSAGSVFITGSEGLNTGSSVTASSTSATTILIDYSYFYGPLSTTGTGFYQIHDSILDCQGINSTVLTTSGTSGNHSINNSTCTSGSASSLVIGAGTTVAVTGTNFASSATNVITGAGGLIYAYISFSGGSSGHNVSTEEAFPTLKPAWQVYLSANIPAVTGDATNYQIKYDTVLFDNSSHYNTGTGLYTFPTTGLYQINVKYFSYVSSGTSTSTAVTATYQINGSTNYSVVGNNGASLVTFTEQYDNVSFIYEATFGDTIAIFIDIGGGTKNIGVGGGALVGCNFSGFLIS